MTKQNWVNIGSGNGLLPDSTKPLPQPMLTSLVRSSDIHLIETNFTTDTTSAMNR